SVVVLLPRPRAERDGPDRVAQEPDAMTAYRPSLWIGSVSLVLAIGGTVAPVRAQGPASSQAWLAAVRSHTPGAADEAVVTVSRWAPGAALATVRKAVRETTDASTLERGLLLHTDAAIAERAALEAGGRLRPGRGALLLDAHTVGSLPRSRQWE